MAQAILFSFLPRRSVTAQRSQDSWAAARPATHAASKRIADLRTVARFAPGSSRDRRAGYRTGSRQVASSKGTDASCPSGRRPERQPAPATRRVAQHPQTGLRGRRCGSRRASHPSLGRRRYDGEATRGPGAREAVSPVGGCALPSHAARAGDQISRPAMAAQTKVAMLPPTMALRPRRARSPRRSGARPAMPPLWMAMELTLAQPQRA